MSTNPPAYRVHEWFHAFQGEGVHMGRSAWFVRLYGCDQRCPWCDSAGTWHRDYFPKDLIVRTAVDVAALLGPEPGFVVITGGEPTLYDLEPLTRVFHMDGRSVHLETAGHRPIRGDLDWVTLSPKPFGKPPLGENVRLANEFKIVVAKPEDVAVGLDAIADRTPGTPVWLHPEWSQRENSEVLAAICAAVASDSSCTLRAGWQLHKLYRVDQLDPRSRPSVPLGGNPALGY
jgi:organic radical activating enzyme